MTLPASIWRVTQRNCESSRKSRFLALLQLGKEGDRRGVVTVKDMITSPADATCELCEGPATVQLADTKTDTDHFFCPKHEPHRSIGERSPRFVIRRWRLAPGNALSLGIAEPKDSVGHKRAYRDMCEAQLLGGEGASRYYLSALTGIDQFALWSDEFVGNVREFLVSASGPAASRFCQDVYSLQFLAGFLRRAYERAEGCENQRRLRKAEKALELLLKHPQWTDERIAGEVPTTLKQLRRWTDYTGLRAVCQRAHKS